MSAIDAEFEDSQGDAGQEIVLAGGARQMVKTGYTTAVSVQKPRDIRRVEKAALEEAALLGESGFYAWGRGDDSIIGPSKHLAMALVRVYGNCAVDMGEVQETENAWIFTATFVDLETGFTLTRQFRQSKQWKVFGKHDQDRKDDMRFQIGQTKATRNVVLNALPQWLIARAMDRAMGGVREQVEKLVKDKGLEPVVAVALKKLEALGVPEARVLEALGRELRGALTVDDLVILKGNIAALESKADTVDNVFPPKEEPKTPRDIAAHAAAAKASRAAGGPQGTPAPAAPPAAPPPPQTAPTPQDASTPTGTPSTPATPPTVSTADIDAIFGKGA